MQALYAHTAALYRETILIKHTRVSRTEFRKQPSASYKLARYLSPALCSEFAEGPRYAKNVPNAAIACRECFEPFKVVVHGVQTTAVNVLSR